MAQLLTARQRIDPDWREWWDERVEIIVVDGKVPLNEAEVLATKCLSLWRETHVAFDYSREGKIYVIHAEGTNSYKIGRSQNPIARLEQLQIGTHVYLHLLREVYNSDVITLEKVLHKRYRHYRTHGEWFDLPEDVISALLLEDFPL